MERERETLERESERAPLPQTTAVCASDGRTVCGDAVVEGGRRGRGKRGGNCPAECVAEMSVGKEIYRRVAAAAASDMLIIAARPPPARDLGCRRSRFLICDAETDRLAPVAARPPARAVCMHTDDRHRSFLESESVGAQYSIEMHTWLRRHSSGFTSHASGRTRARKRNPTMQSSAYRGKSSVRPASPKVISA